MMLQSPKNDPRVTRTRNLIQDAFLSLANEKNFESITVKDIAEKATVNRATFYAHFEDKYSLLDCLVSDQFMTIVSSRIHPETKLTEETLQDLILTMCDYHESIGNHCVRLYKSASVLIDSKIQLKLQDIVLNMLVNSTALASNKREKLELITVMASSSIYCATKRWHSKGKLKNASALVEEILPFVISGIKHSIGKE